MELKTPEKEKVLKRKNFLEEIRKANSLEYVTEWGDPEKIGVSKKKSKVKKGKKAKGAGGRFELKVRKDLEEKEWIVDKWSNNVDLDEMKIIPAKRKFNPFAKVMTIGTGFPDFIAFQHMEEGKYKIIGVEVKMNGTLSKIEKEKCVWYLNKGIFSEIWVAKKVKEGRRVVIDYIDFVEKYKKLFD
ncbi:hypothetical protein HOA55_00905 [archaeon]|jgi:hypothetical protein|nr:hypothetical protein [archaeon]MBT3577640.1 hypothetical protein [archaeon]MBT6819894.1 hypothetical protein [archaeon]MBT6956696.1 hypothetical protein [archaeon]MBT7025050.1 hypothetical protein [archaeon]